MVISHYCNSIMQREPSAPSHFSKPRRLPLGILPPKTRPMQRLREDLQQMFLQNAGASKSNVADLNTHSNRSSDLVPAPPYNSLHPFSHFPSTESHQNSQ